MAMFSALNDKLLKLLLTTSSIIIIITRHEVEMQNAHIEATAHTTSHRTPYHIAHEMEQKLCSNCSYELGTVIVTSF